MIRLRFIGINAKTCVHGLSFAVGYPETLIARESKQSNDLRLSKSDHSYQSFAFKDPTREPDGNAMKKARLATFKINDSWPHDRAKGHGARSAQACHSSHLLVVVSLLL